MVAAALEAYGRLDVAFNNAGIGGLNTPLKDLPAEDWDRLIAVNQRGMFLSCKHELQAMVDRGGRSIVNMGSSTAGWDTIYGGGAYMASKEAVEEPGDGSCGLRDPSQRRLPGDHPDPAELAAVPRGCRGRGVL
jgi:NAD(P)-dependent dehydrogenase (short-subunit alcohol dehydrogenase family)